MILDYELMYKFQQKSIYSTDIYILILSLFSPKIEHFKFAILVKQQGFMKSHHFLFICRITKNFKFTFRNKGYCPS